ncbi:hypothetical protein JXQ31_15630 [candidate division KSB1 bacterium]|nr:hypothetical protein [candidate division KSB1 bacterium]
MDSTGRLAIPTKHRNLFPEDERDTITLTRGSGSFISGYYTSSWKEFKKKLKSVKLSYNNRLRITREFIGRSSVATFDKLGRITLPADLIEHAELEGCTEVFVIGCEDSIEIWNPALHKADHDDTEEIVQTVLDEISID